MVTVDRAQGRSMCLAGCHREISDYNRAHTGSGELTPVLRLGAGACAGIVAMSATYPLDMVRGRLTVQDGHNQQYRGIWHATRTILAQVRKPTDAAGAPASLRCWCTCFARFVKVDGSCQSVGDTCVHWVT